MKKVLVCCLIFILFGCAISIEKEQSNKDISYHNEWIEIIPENIEVKDQEITETIIITNLTDEDYTLLESGIVLEAHGSKRIRTIGSVEKNLDTYQGAPFSIIAQTNDGRIVCEIRGVFTYDLKTKSVIDMSMK